MEKRILITMIVAMLSIATMSARHGKSHSDSIATAATELTGDKVNLSDSSITINSDGKQMVIKFGDLKKIIKDHLDDTVLSSTGVVTFVDDDDDEFDEGEDSAVIAKKDIEAMHDVRKDLLWTARSVTQSVAVAMVFIVFFALLFYYLHRRRRYKTIERAIQAGYTLPDEFYGKRQVQVQQQPATIYVNNVAPQAGTPAGGNVPPAVPQSNPNPLKNITDWAPFKSGLTTTSVGLGLMLFFLVAGSRAMAALMMIIVFVGMSKLFITYQEQQNMKAMWQSRMWAQQQAGDAAGQQNAGGQPVEGQPVPPVTETPPPFGNEQNPSQENL